jgi:hypothetical protein
VYANYDELDLFFKRYDKNRDGKLRYSEFCDAMSPLEPYYMTMLNRRPSNAIITKREDPRDSCFNYSTRQDFKDIWKTHLNVEVQSERLR